MATMSIRISDSDKTKADDLFKELGITTNSAINMFIKQCIRLQRLPFIPSIETPTQRLMESIEEADIIMKEIKEGMEVEQMCRLEEEYGNIRYERGITEGDETRSRKDTIKLLKMNWTLEQISDFVERSIEEVESWAVESSLPYRRS